MSLISHAKAPSKSCDPFFLRPLVSSFVLLLSESARGDPIGKATGRNIGKAQKDDADKKGSEGAPTGKNQDLEKRIDRESDDQRFGQRRKGALEKLTTIFGLKKQMPEIGWLSGFRILDSVPYSQKNGDCRLYNEPEFAGPVEAKEDGTILISWCRCHRGLKCRMDARAGGRLESKLLAHAFMRTTIVRARTILAGALLSFLLACSSMKVQTTKDPQADLSQYKTYAWAPRPRTAPNGPQSSILDQTVKSSVERELAKKGLRPAENSKPDLLISYFGISKNSVTYGTPINPGGPYRPGGPWGPYDSGHYTQPIITREGDLTLQFHDASTKRVVWQGTATGTISEAGAGQEQVAQAVNKLIEKYPAA